MKTPFQGRIDDALAFRIIGFVVSEPGRAQRFLDLTGLDAAQLRSRIDDPTLWRAAIQFVAAHEPDLMACAESLGLPPAELGQMAQMLTDSEM